MSNRTEDPVFSWRYTADPHPVLLFEVLITDSTGGFRLFSCPATRIPLHAALMEHARRGFYDN